MKDHLKKQHALEGLRVKIAKLASCQVVSHTMVKIKAAISDTPSVSVIRTAVVNDICW